MENDITLVVDLDEDSGFYYFAVKEAGRVLHFRPGFRSRQEAEHTGDQWIRDNLGAAPKDDFV